MRTEENALMGMTGMTSMRGTASVAATQSTGLLVDALLIEARIHGGAALLARSGLTVRLMKDLVECMLVAELKHHLHHHPAHAAGKNGNYRNGSTPKTVSTPAGTMELDVPRVRFSTFVPRLVPRYQRQLPGFDDDIIVLYGRGLGMRELQSRLRGLYGQPAWAELSATLSDEVVRHIRDWQARPLDPACALVYFDTLQPRGQAGAPEMDAALLFALGMQADGRRDVLGFWVENTGDATFWREVMCELKGRGLDEPGTIAGADLLGLQEAAELVYPDARFRALR